MASPSDPPPALDARPRPWMPKLILAALALLILSWLGFMAHYVLVGSKQRPRGEPVFPATNAPAAASATNALAR